MKKIILTIVIIAGILINVSATPNEKNKAAEKNLSSTIQGQFSFPEFLKEREGEFQATITFCISGCGALVIKDIQCDDHELKAYLLDQSGNMRINTYGLGKRDIYKVVVRFVTNSN